MRLRKDTKVALISAVPLFAGCSKTDLRRIASIADEIDLAAGTVLTREGQSGGEFCVVVDGEVEVRIGRRRVRTMGSGDFFGEIALLTGGPRTATVTAASPVRLLVVEQHAFRGLLQSVPTIRDRVLESLASRLAGDAL